MLSIKAGHSLGDCEKSSIWSLGAPRNTRNGDSMDERIPNELRDYAWKYFAFHAEQRLKTFHFYVLLAALIIGGLLTVSREGADPRLASPLAFLLTFVSLVFWKLDMRNRQLVWNGERALKDVEANSTPQNQEKEPSPLCLFIHDESLKNRNGQNGIWARLTGPLSYSACFNLVFWVFGIAGLLTGCLLLFRVH